MPSTLRDTPTPFASVSVHLDGAEPTASARHGVAVVTMNSGMAATTLVASDPEALEVVAAALVRAADQLRLSNALRAES